MYIKQLKIEGFKKFKDFTIDFNKQLNIIIGENEAGKSTILEAIDIVLNQRSFMFSNNYESFFNMSNVIFYKEDPSINNLPRLEIEIFLELEEKDDINMEYFNGLHSSSKDIESGIKFTYQFDEDYTDVLENHFSGKDNEIFIPTDYYVANWITFSGRKYVNNRSPLSNVLIDSSNNRNTLFDSYSKKIFKTQVQIKDRQTLSYQFKRKIQSFINTNAGQLSINDYNFGVDESKTVLENLIDLKDDDISIKNKGKGKENLIKTEIALDVNSELILLEEPENHLSYINTRKLISDIREKCDNSQMIITTHNPLIVSRLDLRNSIWINNEKNHSLKDLPESTANYFMKTDNMQLLNYILARKVILVEGNSEYILLPTLAKNYNGFTLDSSNIEVLSGGGITYKNYIELTRILKNNLLVITDNDGNQEVIDEISALNDEFDSLGQDILIKCPNTTKEFTFEVCLYNENQQLLQDISRFKPKTEPKYRGQDLNKNLAYMLKNKTEAALKISEDEAYQKDVKIPTYIMEGLEWLIQK